MKYSKEIAKLEGKAEALWNLGKKEESMICYDKLLEINPDNRRILRKKENYLESIGDFDCDGKKDYSIIADDGTKYVYFSSEGQSNPLDIKTWYSFSKDQKVIRPGYE